MSKNMFEHFFTETRLGKAIRNTVNAVRFVSLNVKEKDGLVEIRGIPTHVIINDIQLIYRTSRIGAHIFSMTHNRGVDIHSFFVPDFIIIIDTLIEDHQGRVSVHTLTNIKNMLYERTWIKDTLKEHPSILDMKQMKRKLIYSPLPHQKEFMDYYDRTKGPYRLRGQLMAMAPGAGKTYASLAIAEARHTDKIIILCPKPALHRVWVAAVVGEGKDNLYKKPQSYWVSTEKKIFSGKERFIIANYEAMPKIMDRMNKIKGDKITLILDESHNFNELNAKRTQNFTLLAKELDPQDTLLLSGTPIKAMAVESVPLLRALDPLFTKDVEDVFKKVYAGNNNGAVALLRQRLGVVSFTVEKHELGLDVPIVSTTNVTFKNADEYTIEAVKEKMEIFIKERTLHYENLRPGHLKIFWGILNNYEDKLSRPQRVDYETYKTHLGVVMDATSYFHVTDEMKAVNQYERLTMMPALSKVDRDKFKSVKSPVKYAKLTIIGEMIGRVVGKARMEANLGVASAIDYRKIVESSAKKTVVFASNVAVVEEAIRQCSKFTHPLGVYGKFTKDLPAIVKKFGDVPEHNVLCATYASLSTAVPLTMADQVILIDVPFRAHVLEQATSRVHRLGSDSTAKFYYTRLNTGQEPNIADRSFDIIAWAQQQVEEITGVESPMDFTDTTISVECYNDIIVFNNNTDTVSNGTNNFTW